MYTYSASVSYHVLFILRVVNVVYVARSHLLIFIACERHLLCQQHKTAMRSVPDPFSAGVGLACETTWYQRVAYAAINDIPDYPPHGTGRGGDFPLISTKIPPWGWGISACVYDVF